MSQVALHFRFTPVKLAQNYCVRWGHGPVNANGMPAIEQQPDLVFPAETEVGTNRDFFELTVPVDHRLVFSVHAQVDGNWGVGKEHFFKVTGKKIPPAPEQVWMESCEPAAQPAAPATDAAPQVKIAQPDAPALAVAGS